MTKTEWCAVCAGLSVAAGLTCMMEFISVAMEYRFAGSSSIIATSLWVLFGVLATFFATVAVWVGSQK